MKERKKDDMVVISVHIERFTFNRCYTFYTLYILLFVFLFFRLHINCVGLIWKISAGCENLGALFIF